MKQFLDKCEDSAYMEVAETVEIDNAIVAEDYFSAIRREESLQLVTPSPEE